MALKGALHRMAAAMGLRVERIEKDRDRVSMSLAEFTQLMSAYGSLLGRGEDATILPPDDRRTLLMSRLLGTPPSEAYALLQALVATQKVAGDVCEFGVAQGSTSALIANEIRSERRALHLFDSFDGMPAPTERDRLIDDPSKLGSIEAYEGTWSFPREMVEARLVDVGFPVDRTHIHAGFIEQVLADAEHLPTHVSCAYVDFDFYDPIRQALDFLDGVLSPQGIVIIDDYGFFSAGAQAAVDEFVEERNRQSPRYRFEVADEVFGRFATLWRLE